MTLFSKEADSRLAFFLRELAPAPGRTAAVLRFTLTTVLATLLLLIMQPPPRIIAPSLFLLFLVSHESAFSCFKDLATCLTMALVGTVAAVGLIAATGNHPMARVLGLAIFTFIAGFFRVSASPLGAWSFGCISFMVISFWELQVPAEQALHLSLWPLATLSVVALCAVAVDYAFNHGTPLASLQREITACFDALEQMFRLGAQGPGTPELEAQVDKVRKYAVTSHLSMHSLLERVPKRQLSGDANRAALETLILRLSRLLDLGAAFATQTRFEEQDPARLHRISLALGALRAGEPGQLPALLGARPAELSGELDRLEQTLQDMGEHAVQPSAEATEHEGERQAKPRRSWLSPDVLSNPQYLIYAFKLSLCATICYIIYNALGWPGISTAYFTVLFTGMSTTGETNRKLLFRLIGSTIGGIFLGLSALVFVFPNIESVTPFLLVIAAVSFVGVWIAGSRYYGYIGMQIVFSFNLLAFETYSAATEMTPARDRILGIFLGLIVMFFIFHQLRAERTVDTMRINLARLLRTEAALVSALKVEAPGVQPSSQVIQFRARIAQLFIALRGFSDVIAYEFEPDRSADMATSKEIMRAASTSASLVLSAHVWPSKEDTGAADALVAEFHNDLESGLQELASALEQPGTPAAKQKRIERLLDGLPVIRPRFMEKALGSFRELQMLCESIVAAED